MADSVALSTSLPRSLASRRPLSSSLHARARARSQRRCRLGSRSLHRLRAWAGKEDPEDLYEPTFLYFSPFRFFCTIMSFVVSFQKMDPNLGAVIIGVEVTHSGAGIIGANFSYVAADVASLTGSAPRSMAPTSWDLPHRLPRRKSWRQWYWCRCVLPRRQ
jgi:hypothetical protein